MKILRIHITGGVNDKTAIFTIACQRCGAILDSSERFCPQCGQKLRRLKDRTDANNVTRVLNAHISELGIDKDKEVRSDGE